MKGILMTPSNHRAIREGKKTQTRRLYHLKEINKAPDDWVNNGWDGSWQGFAFTNKTIPDMTKIVKPPYQVGEMVYIKEAVAGNQGQGWLYKSDFEAQFTEIQRQQLDPIRWRSPMFMPACAARDFAKITAVGLGRLHDITEADAIAEGRANTKSTIEFEPLVADFAKLWDTIYGKTYPFDGNYWAWRICFELVSQSD